MLRTWRGLLPNIGLNRIESFGLAPDKHTISKSSRVLSIRLDSAHCLPPLLTHELDGARYQLRQRLFIFNRDLVAREKCLGETPFRKMYPHHGRGMLPLDA